MCVVGRFCFLFLATIGYTLLIIQASSLQTLVDVNFTWEDCTSGNFVNHGLSRFKVEVNNQSNLECIQASTPGSMDGVSIKQ